VIVLCVLGLWLQEFAHVTDASKPVTDYQIVDFAYTQPFTKPPTPPSQAAASVIVPMGTVPPGQTWTFTIRYADNAGHVYFDDHDGVYHATTNPRGADQLVKTLLTGDYTKTSINKMLLEHLIVEKAIPPSTITGTPPKAVVQKGQ
jgi:hypothetical protein